MSEHPCAASSDPSQATDGSPARPSRRGFLQSAAAAASALALPHESAGARTDASAPARPAALAPARPVSLNINGKPYALSLEPRVTLLDALREVLGLTGTKKGCDRGQCGACTVLVNGRRINSCLTLAIMHEGEAITTVEGLAHAHEGVVDRAALHPVQAAFLEHDAFQCGYCTPGQICSAVAVLEEARRGMPSAVTSPAALGNDGAVALTEDEIRERMSGNLCRCGAYPNIVAAIRVVAAKSGNVA
ncbi:2Fe-2S iron-sulfur cluster binding domain-containing protein [Ralstonia pickettii]|uniref:2Fe-2S iron-sulfur cluster binding domain-containing protein n=1 Tax=Ralstonia pickettii TaxID=329 RepID=A0A7X2HQK7_RALPI|nr:2Fe-2S iron-sulfur cluster-binding protein [Ralstonia pickettii]MRT00855.1 2Fe-2S iron-sulfur cluster binding domain-containing protein [Ralstonia pickettii]